MFLERLERRRADRVDLGAHRGGLLQRRVDLAGDQPRGTGELPERRLDVHSGHVTEVGPHGVEVLRHPAEPAGDGPQPVRKRRGLPGQERVDRVAGVPQQRVPLVLPELLEVEQELPELRGQDLRVHPVRGVELRDVDLLQRREVA